MTDLAELRAWQPFEITADGGQGTPEALAELLRGHEDFAGLLTREKAVVFRGFHLTEETLDPVLDLLLPNRLAYVHGNSPRTKVGSNVYTSTEYPQELTISMHNELSYGRRWPSRLVFFCATAPATGGATPIVDGELWLASLDPEVREAFAGGVRYTQNLHDGLGLGKSWQETFETTDRAEVEAYLRGAECDWKWLPDGTLRITQVRHSTLTHPETGAEVWFNQSDQWHPASLGDETAAELAQILPEEELPQSVTFADGSPIPAEHVLQVRDRGLENAVDVDWHQGDLMVIDNVAVGHGRRSFTGPRRVLVAMTD
ncbi:TauD/TfdA family dioxygenase [Streptomyces sp. V4I2]|uniref:TauD/TfdA family dioxygenase n=1 Tax=Streptomyces sp. V4I2 TaxID=3042280 RepID=UPI00278A96F9|nr:TauD/TfdA family dioxygenase [Streptomyces sp. V4I2]MDQ1045003.1 alpha-ketoglutarate-dependent taurine dioxygenase [Streptomyces sp. V4I2]